MATSTGECGVHTYANITQGKINEMLTELNNQGATVSGSNPWTINTNKYSIVLQGTWDESTSTLSVIVTGKSWLVPCSKIWGFIDPLINGLSAMSEEDFAQHVR